MKTCSRCKQPKELEEFSKNRAARDGLTYCCRECARRLVGQYRKDHPEKIRRMKKKWNGENRLRINASKRAGYRKNVERYKSTQRKALYGISGDQFNKMILNQNHKCSICDLFFDRTSRMTVPHIDHDHVTGKVRGLLCGNCNSGIGHLKDSPDRLLRAVEYLKKFEYLSVLF